MSFLGVSFPAQNPLATLTRFCSPVWLMCLCFSAKVYTSGMPIVNNVLLLSSFFSWFWQTQSQWCNSAGLLAIMARKAADFSVGLSGGIRHKVHTTTWLSYDLLASKATNPPLIQTLTSILFPSQIPRNTRLIYSTPSLLEPITNSRGIAMIQV